MRIGRLLTSLGGRRINSRYLCTFSDKLFRQTARCDYGRTISAQIQGAGMTQRRFSTDVDAEIEERLRKTIEAEKLLIFIKGTPEEPQCQYSAKLIGILNNYKLNDYAYINVFSHEALRRCVKKISDWPTFPQVYVNGRLIGGSDIVEELHSTGELKKLFESGE
ncbi:glutaredoxin domain-containing protein [Theileria equi strain WA]|uniref:Glutaredoxin domain-containing protein n=1 Tax=Theileria equi strain WA TaxID=1537102 RepID=L0B0L0_THEEQ|nr:glutaredoxin domain-containing protein [Theileria equi strain WA]AFZ81038.1 glutaredoxin domain-containing protein [Theileria equi strain WA]|eukprot:XP_004830704.1 glutaredoxin domain-containing protein [Theileria equi strain WA]